MHPRQWLLLAILMLIVVVILSIAVWVRRAGIPAGNAMTELKAIGGDLARLPGRLRRLAADPRVPCRVRWKLIGLAISVASPIDIVPDFLPGIGHLEEVILVQIDLRRNRRMIPAHVWSEHFPVRKTTSGEDQPIGSNTRADRSG